MSNTVQSAGPKNRGPWWHRFFIRLCTLALFVLIFMTLGFFTDDIWKLAGPSYSSIEQQFVQTNLLAQESGFQQQLDHLERDIRDQRETLSQLQASTATSQATWKQLLEFRRLAIEKGTQLSDAEQQALNHAQELFLKNQQSTLALQETLADSNRQQNAVRDHLTEVERQLQQQRSQANAEYSRLWERHRFWLGVLQLCMLIPLLLVAGWGLARYRSSLWSPFVLAFSGAVFAKVLVILHGYFPIDALIYPLVGTALLVVGAVLWGLIRTLSRPQTPWLLRQYRDAYQSFLCPVCDYPIRRGPLKYLFWTRKSVKRLPLAVNEASQGDEPYTCPCCGTPLFETCTSCQHTRHSLLPACESCGVVKEIIASAA